MGRMGAEDPLRGSGPRVLAIQPL